MMKKLLVLSLVLGVASLASAGLDLSGYDGSVLNVNDTVALSVSTNADVTAFQLFNYVVIVKSGNGTLSGGTAAYGNILGDLPIGGFNVGEYSGMAATYLASFMNMPTAGTEFVSDIGFTCTGAGDVVVELWTVVDMDPSEADDFQLDTLEDSITISQVPEPATLALLGLGALVLRRKK
jgi:hypothetical protein